MSSKTPPHPPTGPRFPFVLASNTYFGIVCPRRDSVLPCLGIASYLPDDGFLVFPPSLAVTMERSGVPGPFYFYFPPSQSSICSESPRHGNAIFLAGMHLLELSLIPSYSVSALQPT